MFGLFSTVPGDTGFELASIFFRWGNQPKTGLRTAVVDKHISSLVVDQMSTEWWKGRIFFHCGESLLYLKFVFLWCPTLGGISRNHGAPKTADKQTYLFLTDGKPIISRGVGKIPLWTLQGHGENYSLLTCLSDEQESVCVHKCIYKLIYVRCICIWIGRYGTAYTTWTWQSLT